MHVWVAIPPNALFYAVERHSTVHLRSKSRHIIHSENVTNDSKTMAVTKCFYKAPSSLKPEPYSVSPHRSEESDPYNIYIYIIIQSTSPVSSIMSSSSVNDWIEVKGQDDVLLKVRKPANE